MATVERSEHGVWDLLSNSLAIRRGSVAVEPEQPAGAGRPGWIRLVGFALFVECLSTTSPKMLKKVVPQVVLGYVGWVVGSVLNVLFRGYSGGYSGAGDGAVLAVAVAVAVAVDVWAALQR
ncbi:MAG: hypothetical protein ACI9CV_000393 [Ilumatobacter sp.]